MTIVRLIKFILCITTTFLNLQADKDFVWGLWKKLQVSNPDVTEAISLVVQRLALTFKIKKNLIAIIKP